MTSIGSLWGNLTLQVGVIGYDFRLKGPVSLEMVGAHPISLFFLIKKAQRLTTDVCWSVCCAPCLRQLSLLRLQSISPPPTPAEVVLPAPRLVRSVLFTHPKLKQPGPVPRSFLTESCMFCVINDVKLLYFQN